jgi:predicted permease
VLALLGGVLGLLAGWAGVRAFASFAAEELPRGAEIAMDVRTVVVALAIALTAGLIFGVIPVMRLLRGSLSSVFREEGRTGTASRATRTLRGGLVVAQVSIAFALLIGAGLMVASFVRMLRVDPGFQADHLLTASVSMPVTRYPDDVARRQFTSTLLQRMHALPGVDNAAVTNLLPFGDNMNSSVVTAEGYVPQPEESLVAPINSYVSAAYFSTMGIGIVAGREFTDGDVGDAPPVAIVDRTLAERFWPDRDPIGQRITQGAPDITPEELTYRTVVGVVDDVRVHGITGDQPPGHYYVPLAQQPAGRLFLTARTRGDALAMANTMRALVTELDPDLPLYQVMTMDQRVSASLTTERARMILLVGFASLALMLAAVGLYGVLAYTVVQRSGEIGIRMALGSSSRDVFRMVLGEGARLVATGLALGLVGSIALSRLVSSMLYDVAPTDPVVYVVVLVLLSITALVASAVPARRAMRVDPLVAMRDA